MVIIWIAISASATLLLAGAAFLTIWLNYRTTKAEKDFLLKTAALGDIHQWVLDIENTITLFLSAIVEKDKDQKYRAFSECTLVLFRGGHLVVAAKLFDQDLSNKVERVQECSFAYRKALNEGMPGQPISNEIKEISQNHYDALGDVFATLGAKKLELLTKHFPKRKRGEVDKGKKLSLSAFFKKAQIRTGKEPEDTDKGR